MRLEASTLPVIDVAPGFTEGIAERLGPKSRTEAHYLTWTRIT
jgi:hypothetical protein